MIVRIATLTFLAAAFSLAACSSTPVETDSAEPVTHFDPAKDPYWQDPRWDKALLDAIQSVVHDPVDAADTSAPGLHATVKFAFLDGAIEYPEITASTGKQDLDKLMLRQVASAKVPRPTGIGTDQPHEFELDLQMLTPFESFQDGIYATIDTWKIYPVDAIRDGWQGSATVSFDYLDGKAGNIVVTKSSGNKDLDRASLAIVTRATLPPTPAGYVGKTLHMEATFCYALYQSENDRKRCPTGSNVILVTGTRIR